VLEHCRTVVLPDQGHSVLVERTKETRDLLLEWIRDHHVTGHVPAQRTAAARPATAEQSPAEQSQSGQSPAAHELAEALR
jgi:hypothetical protein